MYCELAENKGNSIRMEVDPLKMCRLCYTKVDTGLDIFKKPRKKLTYSNDLLDLLQISVSDSKYYLSHQFF